MVKRSTLKIFFGHDFALEASRMSKVFVFGGRFALPVLAVILFAPDVMAQTSNPTGFGMSLGIGSSRIQDEDSPGDTFDGSGFGWNMDFEWRFIEYLAAGGSRTSLGEATDNFNGAETTISVDGYGLYIRGYLPVTQKLVLHARYGETSYSVDIEPGAGTVFPFNSSAKDYGVGGDYYVNDNLAIRIEARRLDGPSQEEGALTTIGLRWQF